MNAYIALTLMCVSALTVHAADTPFPLVVAEECHARQGLPNFIKKARTAGASVKVAYLGGSITAQAGWRPKTLAYFQKIYPTAKFTEINAAIGGTGSDLGVFRLKHDVLDGKPDLLFVEFATNDGGAPPLQIQKTMEGIVRQTWTTLPNCDICFVYTLVESESPAMFDGKYPRAASAMEAVAAHYGIPSIHMAMEVTKLAKAGTLLWKVKPPRIEEEKKQLGEKIAFAEDGVHPYPETGHELYLQAIVRSWTPITDASTTPGAHALKKPLHADNYEDAKMIPVAEADLSKGFVALDAVTDNVAKHFAERVKPLYRATQPGETMSFKFKGKYAGIYDVIGPDSGQMIVTVDDQPPRVAPRFDSFCRYHRLAVLTLAADLPDAVHTVKIEIHREQQDKAKILAGSKQTIDNPERYNGTAFYPGAILLRGDLVK